MTREAEERLLAFCAAQRDDFDVAAWGSFDAVSRLELAATARYLAGVDWYGHQRTLAGFADGITRLNFEQLTREVDFEPSRFRGMLQARLLETARAEA